MEVKINSKPLTSLRWRIAQFFEQQWWRWYLLRKPKETYLSWKIEYWEQFLARITPSLPLLFEGKSLRILDAGCGPAGIFTALPHHNVTAVDPLLSHYESMPHFQRSAYPTVFFQESRLEEYSSGQPFDLIFCLNVINHVEDLSLCMDNLHALLKPGGHLVMTIDVHVKEAAKRILQLIPLDILHPHQFSLQEYEAHMGTDLWCIEKRERIKEGGLFEYYLLISRALDR